jgi:hypothetical protein
MTSPEPPPATKTRPKRKRSPWVLGSIAAAVVCSIGGCATTPSPGALSTSAKSTPATTTAIPVTLDSAYVACGSHGDRATGSDGVTVDLDTSSTAVGSSRAATISDITCVLTTLGAPTTSPGTRGTLKIDWGPYDAIWTNTEVGGVEVFITEHPGTNASPAVTSMD